MPIEAAEGTSDNAAFIRIHTWFVNIDRGTGRLLRLLATRSAALSIVHWSTPLISTRVRSCALYILGSIGVKCALGRLMRRFGRGGRLVSLPDRGHVAMFCFPDCTRIFDLAEGRITNLCHPSGRDSRRRLSTMLDEQEALGRAGLAPAIIRREGDSYIEELCDATPLKTRAWWDKRMFREVTSAARAIQASKPTTARNTEDLVEEMNGHVEQLRSVRPDALDGKDAEWLAAEIQAACDSVEPGQTLEGFLSHGDLARRNILVQRDDSLVFIDWQTLDYRTRDYDVYNYFFSVVEDGCTEQLPEDTIFAWLQEALGFQDPDAALTAFNRFRLEFFLTRFKYFLLSPGCDAARMSKVLAQVHQYARCFTRYAAYSNAARHAA